MNVYIGNLNTENTTFQNEKKNEIIRDLGRQYAPKDHFHCFARFHYIIFKHNYDSSQVNHHLGT